MVRSTVYDRGVTYPAAHDSEQPDVWGLSPAHGGVVLRGDQTGQSSFDQRLRNNLWFKGRDGTLRRLTGLDLALDDYAVEADTGTMIATVEASHSDPDRRLLVVRSIATGRMERKVDLGPQGSDPWRVQAFVHGTVWLSRPHGRQAEGHLASWVVRYLVGPGAWRPVGALAGREIRPTENVSWATIDGFFCPLQGESCPDWPRMSRLGAESWNVVRVSPTARAYAYESFRASGDPLDVFVHDMTRSGRDGAAPRMFSARATGSRYSVPLGWFDDRHLAMAVRRPEAESTEWAVVSADIKTGHVVRVTRLFPAGQLDQIVVFSDIPFAPVGDRARGKLAPSAFGSSS